MACFWPLTDLAISSPGQLSSTLALGLVSAFKILDGEYNLLLTRTPKHTKNEFHFFSQTEGAARAGHQAKVKSTIVIATKPECP